MKIKYVEELNYNEFIKLCNANNVIQEEAYNEAIETLEDELLDIIHREYNYACDHYDEFFAEFMDDYQSELNTCFVVNADTFELIEIEEEAIC